MYIAIVQDHQTMMRAVKLEADNETKALAECASLDGSDEAKMLRVHFLIAKDGDIQRVVCTKEDGFSLHRSAFKVLGICTAPEQLKQDVEEEE